MTATTEFDGAKAALLIGQRLVTILRDDIPAIAWPGWWDLPGGGREGAERPEDTIIREVREELGLALDPVQLGWRHAFPSATRAGSWSWFFVAHLPASAETQIVFGNEGQAWRLVAVEDFLDDARAIPHLKERLQIWQVDRGRPGRP